LPAHFYALSDAKLEPLQRIKAAEAFFADVPADIRSGGNLAYYNIGQDFVQLPPFEAFRDAESFYATKAHELAHWTRHEKRLNRSFGRKRWGYGYAAEELVAELASAFLCVVLGLTPDVREDHAS
jgi:antirestriction protein ArdC